MIQSKSGLKKISNRIGNAFSVSTIMNSLLLTIFISIIFLFGCGEDSSHDKETIIQHTHSDSSTVAEEQPVSPKTMTANDQVKVVQETNGATDAKTEKAIKKIEIHEKELGEIKSELQQLEMQIKGLSDSLDNQELDMTRGGISKKEMEKIKAKIRKQLKKLEDRRKDIQDDIAELESKIKAKIRKQLKKLEDRRKDIQDDIAELESKIKAIHTQIGVKPQEEKPRIELFSPPPQKEDNSIKNTHPKKSREVVIYSLLTVIILLLISGCIAIKFRARFFHSASELHGRPLNRCPRCGQKCKESESECPNCHVHF